MRIKHQIQRIKYRNNVEKYVGHFFLCGSECPDKSGVYEYCKRLPPYSLPDVMMEFVLGLRGGPTLSLPAAQSYVGIINSRVLTTSRPDLSTAVPTLQIINYFYGSTFFLADFSNFIFGNESASSSAVFVLTLCFRVR